MTVSEAMVYSSEHLRKLFEAFDELGLTHRYSEELGEFDVKMGEHWLTFYVDPKVLADEREDVRWAVDAEQVADYYWRQ